MAAIQCDVGEGKSAGWFTRGKGYIQLEEVGSAHWGGGHYIGQKEGHGFNRQDGRVQAEGLAKPRHSSDKEQQVVPWAS